MFGGVVEATLRPVYQSALVGGDKELAHFYLRKWSLIILFGCFVAIVVAWIGHSWLASILLGEQYRNASYLMPWIVAGYSLLVISHILNRVCYANEATKSIFLIEITGAVFAIVVGFVCIKWAGLTGAAIAISLYFGAQLILSYLFAKDWLVVSMSSAVEQNQKIK